MRTSGARRARPVRGTGLRSGFSSVALPPPPPCTPPLAGPPPDHPAGRVVVATDGALEAGLAAWAATDGEAVARGPLDGQDQSSFAAEVEGIRQVLRAAAAGLGVGQPAELILLVDSRAALSICVRASPPLWAAGQWADVRNAVAALRARAVETRWQWVPAHDRPAERYRAAYVPEHQARALNRMADHLATTALRARLEAPARQAWDAETRAAVDTSAAWLRLAIRVGRRLGVVFPGWEAERRPWDLS